MASTSAAIGVLLAAASNNVIQWCIVSLGGTSRMALWLLGGLLTTFATEAELLIAAAATAR